MSSDIAISVDGLGKCYRIRHLAKRATSFAQVVRGVAAAPFKHLADRLRKPEETELFWALQDVSFEVRRGEVIGIIGRNGAGKSTLLKILSRITDPTTGHAEIRGRVNSLLEVGTGFHPELTGRENIFMNAAMHGMKRAEINTKLDEIIAFAEVEKFIDTPVKRYSSGMYTRLAFAVAAHLEPEILVVDEVLAVGDVAFQRKCIGKMRSVAGAGMTVLLVSHNMSVVQDLAHRAVHLDGGRIKNLGFAETVVRGYMRAGQVAASGVDLANHANREPRFAPVLRACTLQDGTGEARTEFVMSDEIVLGITYSQQGGDSVTHVGFNIKNENGSTVTSFNTAMVIPLDQRIPTGGTVRFTLPRMFFCPGEYFVSVSAATRPDVLLDRVELAASFTIRATDVYGTGYRLSSANGVCALFCKVRFE